MEITKLLHCLLSLCLTAQALEQMPLNGFGTWNIKSDKMDNVSQIVATAIEVGYRHIDCAAIYGNEIEVGRGIADGLERAGITREDIWVTSKLWNNAHGSVFPEMALQKTLQDLGLDYLDLYLMHWPIKTTEAGNEIEFEETYEAMLALPKSSARHIGVSNFSPTRLGYLSYKFREQYPYAHQMESHPYLPQPKYVEIQNATGIIVQAYSPLGNTNPIYTSWRKQASGDKVTLLLENPVIAEIAEARQCTAAQVVLKWGMKRGTAVLPKTINIERMRENIGAEKCELTDEDMRKIKKLPKQRFNDPSESWGLDIYEERKEEKSKEQESKGEETAEAKTRKVPEHEL